MHKQKPLNINLYLTDNLPAQKGGSFDLSVINNKYKYLKADKTVETFINGSSKIINDVELWFEIDIDIEDKKDTEKTTNVKNKDIKIFNIKQLKEYSNIKVKNFKNELLVIQLFTLRHKNMDTFIEEWKINSEIFNNSIIDIYIYGNLLFDDGQIISNFIITKKYNDFTTLLKLNYSLTIKYIVKLLYFLIKCNDNNIILRDLKFSSIGFHIVNSEIEFVLIDYNETSLLKITDDYFNNFINGCDAMNLGSLVPYFIITDFFEIKDLWKQKLNKSFVIGLAEILIFLLYKEDENMENILKIIYKPSYLTTCFHYYQFMKFFDNIDNRTNFIKLIAKLVPKFDELDTDINRLFIRIIQNNFDIKYDNIKTPQDYLNNILKRYNELNIQQSNIKTLIKPIQTFDTNFTSIIDSSKTKKYKIVSQKVDKNTIKLK
jgi:hypothetical protein